MAEYLIEMDNLRAGYRGRDVLRGVRLRVREGEICALLGLNGSGKSTLLRAALGLIPAQADRLLLGGEDVRGASPGRVAQLAAYIPQRSRMDGGMTALEAVLLGANARMPLLAAYSAGQRKAARTCLTEAGAQALADCLVGELSEGQRQLVVLARALMQQPKALLLDEPDGALDLPRRYAMMRAVRRQAAQGRAALVALHDASLALTACDRVFILKEGQIFAELDMERADEAAVRDALRALYGDVTAVKIGEKWAVLGE